MHGERDVGTIKPLVMTELKCSLNVWPSVPNFNAAGTTALLRNQPTKWLSKGKKLLLAVANVSDRIGLMAIPHSAATVDSFLLPHPSRLHEAGSFYAPYGPVYRPTPANYASRRQRN